MIGSTAEIYTTISKIASRKNHEFVRDVIHSVMLVTPDSDESAYGELYVFENSGFFPMTKEGRARSVMYGKAMQKIAREFDVCIMHRRARDCDKIVSELTGEGSMMSELVKLFS